MTRNLRRCVLASALALLLTESVPADPLRIEVDEAAGKISVFREGGERAILVQNARPDFRPYLHPIVAPDGLGELTEYSPGHHRHQTGLYWGFTRLNGRDYFHHPEGTHWRRASFGALPVVRTAEGDQVGWKTVYDLLDEDGEPVLRETQSWSLLAAGGEYRLDLDWRGAALRDVTVSKYDYGGLFLRMPWKEGIDGEVVNAARERGRRAEGRRSLWVDTGMTVAGREDRAHVAIFDHPKNGGFPQPWRVDGQLGVGPVRARLGDWKIAKGKTEHIRHRIIVYTGQLDDVALTKKWSEYTGLGGTWALWGIAQNEGREAKFLSPAEAVAAMDVPEGFSVNAFASEPMITQPMAFCWDDRGRLWIAENRDYESRGHGFSASGDSRILILEDSDRDGVADVRKVFAEGIPFPAGIAVGLGGLWLGAPPNLLFVPDRDGDDVADEDDIEVRLTGWGIRDRHETLNSFHWGPDGWLYGCQGFATPSRVGKPKGRGRLYRHKEPFPKDIEFADEPVDINGGIWRYHPTKERFEVVAHGFSNPWGIDYDAKGQLFISACVIPHLWHVIPGGIYHRQGGRHFNPYVFSDIRTIADHRHRSAHGGARVYLSDALPEEYRGRLFMANIHEHAVLTDILERRGSGFIGRHGDDFLHANNAQWIGFSMEIGPEGGVYVLDWHDADICGKDVLQKDTGRVYRILPKTSRAKDWKGRYGDLASQSDVELAAYQRSESSWHARRARVVLQGRAAGGGVSEDAIARLRQIFRDDENQDWRLRALWALHVVGALDEAALAASLEDNDEYVRAWSIQLLCEDRPPSDAVREVFTAMAHHDRSPVVRLYLAAALQRLEHEQRWTLADALLSRVEDIGDHNIPKMLWFGIEPLVAGNAERALRLAQRSSMPMLSNFIARRLAHADKHADVVDVLRTPSLVERHLLEGLRDGLEGRKELEAPPAWGAVYGRLASSTDPEISRVALSLSQRFGDAGATARLAETVQSSESSVDERRAALRALANQSHASLLPVLASLLDVEELRLDAIRAMAAYEDDRLADTLLARYPKFDATTRLEVVQTLASRSASGWKLAQAIQRGEVPKREVPAYVARQLRRVVGSGFVEIWGPVDALPADTARAIEKYRTLLTAEAIADADPLRGHRVFQTTCAACHRLYGEGGAVGPDITGANRSDLTYLLGNILTPSEVIQDDYRMTTILTREGRLYSGILVGEDPRQIRLRVATQPEPVTVSKASIASREIAPVSMMPEGLLQNLSDAEVLDLIAYLQTTEKPPKGAAAPGDGK